MNIENIKKVNPDLFVKTDQLEERRAKVKARLPDLYVDTNMEIRDWKGNVLVPRFVKFEKWAENVAEKIVTADANSNPLFHEFSKLVIKQLFFIVAENMLLDIMSLTKGEVCMNEIPIYYICDYLMGFRDREELCIFLQEDANINTFPKRTLDNVLISVTVYVNRYSHVSKAQKYLNLVQQLKKENYKKIHIGGQCYGE